MTETVTGLPQQLFNATNDDRGVIAIDLTKEITWTDYDYDPPRAKLAFLGSNEYGGIDVFYMDNIVEEANNGNLFTDLTKAKARTESLRKTERERQERSRQREAKRAGEPVDGGSF